VKNILSLEETALVLGYSKRTLQNKFWSKEKSSLPPAHKTGRKIYFFRDEVEQWLRQQPVVNAPKKRVGRPRKNVTRGVA